MKLLEQGRDIQGIEKEIYDQLSQKLKILDELKQELDEKKVTDGLQIDYRDGDGQLKVVSCTGELLTGILSFDGGEIHVAGKPARKDLGVYGDKGPRQVKIYKKIAANTSVHPFYGIARASGQNWALFKDLRHSPSLGKVISQDEFQDDMVARLAIAHEVALTVEYLHSIEILVKRLSDKNVILVMEGNVWKPCLIDIERARLVDPSAAVEPPLTNTSSSPKPQAVAITMFDTKQSSSRKCITPAILSTPTFGGR